MAPSEIQIPEIEQRLMKMEELRNIHHIHVWNLTDKLIHFEGHIALQNDIKVSDTQKILKKVQKILHDEFDIEHVTIQFEYGKPKADCDC